MAARHDDPNRLAGLAGAASMRALAEVRRAAREERPVSAEPIELVIHLDVVPRLRLLDR